MGAATGQSAQEALRGGKNSNIRRIAGAYYVESAPGHSDDQPSGFN